MNFDFGLRDLPLLLGVSILVTVIAFLHRPRAKALVFSMPVPFLLANISLGQPMGAGHVAGLLIVPLYLNMVRWLHANLGFPIIPSIAVSAATYIGAGIVLNRTIPDTSIAFWFCEAAVLALALPMAIWMRARSEPGRRSNLPIPVKFLAVGSVITIIVMLKNILGGIMTTFPLAGVIAAYESRSSLWTLSRQAPLILLAMGSMMVAMYLTQTYLRFSVVLSLVPGLFAWACLMVPLIIVRWRLEDRSAKTAIP